MLMRAILLACLLAGCACQQGAESTTEQQAAPLRRQEVALQPFVEVDNCLPINVLIQPNATTDTYSIALEGEPAVLQARAALSYNITDNALQLESTGDFDTARPTKVTVTMPAGALQAINHQGSGGEVYVAPGFNVRGFVGTSSFGAGRLYINNMVASTAALLMSGTGDTVLLGSFGTVNVTSTGTGGIYISGANDTVWLDLRGVSNAFVQPAQPTTRITGTAQGINTVQYTDGTCSVSSNFAFIQICQSVPFISIPRPFPVWTCGLQARGSFQCTTSGTAYTSSPSGFVGASGGTGSVPVTTTTPPGVSAFTPSSFQFAGASPAGPGTGVQQQAGSITPGGTTAQSNIAGTGSVSSTSIAGQQGAVTSTTQNGQTTGFQTTGQGTQGSTTPPVTGGGMPGLTSGATGSATGGTTSSASATSTSSSTAFTTASPGASASATSASSPSSVQQAASQGTTQSAAGVIRVGPDGRSEATAMSQACQATVAELRMPLQGTQ